MMITMMIVLVFISDGSSTAAGLVRCCGSSSSGQRSRIVTIGSDGIAAMLFAHLRKSSGVSVPLAPVGTGLGSTTSTFTSGLGLVLALCDASTGFALAAATFCDGARHAARHPSSDPCHANTDTRCDRPCGPPLWSCSLSMHARRLATTTPQQQWRQYACSKRMIESRTCSRDKPRERPSSVNVTLPVLYASGNRYRSVGQPQRNLRVKLDVGDLG